MRLLVGQFGGPTAVLNASLYGVLSELHAAGAEAVGVRGGGRGLLAGDFVPLPGPPPAWLPVTPGAALGAVAAAVPQPLVLHGCSGLDAEQLGAAIDLGIAKVNVDTAPSVRAGPAGSARRPRVPGRPGTGAGRGRRCRAPAGAAPHPRLPQRREGLMVTAAQDRVLVAEFMDAAGLDLLATAAGVSYRPELAGDREALIAAVRGTRALIVRNRCRVDAEVLQAAGGALRVVGRLGSGLDNIDLAACRTAGVRVVYARGANADAVCEYVFAALLHLMRRLAEADRATRGGAWPREAFIGEELGGRTLGLVGLGEIGKRVSRRAAAWGMRVLGMDPCLDAEEAERQGLPLQLVPFEELLASSDIVSLHVPLTPATRHLLDAAAIRRLRPGAIVVNAARGGIVDEQALAGALRAGQLRGAILDVREVEPPPQPDALASLPGVLLTPHVAGLTREAQAKVATMVAADVLAVLQGRLPEVPA